VLLTVIVVQQVLLALLLLLLLLLVVDLCCQIYEVCFFLHCLCTALSIGATQSFLSIAVAQDGCVDYFFLWCLFSLLVLTCVQS
jgi:hypothetical protein